MKFKCDICERKVETNDSVFEYQICSSIVDGKELGDLIHSPIYSEKICSWCAGHIHTILFRGIKKLKEEERK